MNQKSWEESVPAPVQDSVAGGPGEQSESHPVDDISDEQPVIESTESQPEQILNLQPPTEQLPEELLDRKRRKRRLLSRHLPLLIS